MDSGENGRVTLQIIRGNEAGHFLLDSNGALGDLRLLTFLDRESTDYYLLDILAVDNGPAGDHLETKFSLRIDVLDTNDNVPAFDGSAAAVEDGAVVFVSSATASGTELIDFHASDNDEGPNQELRYAIVGHTGTPRVHIDTRSGRMTLANSLPAPGTSFTVTVSVLDRGSPPLSASKAAAP